MSATRTTPRRTLAAAFLAAGAGLAIAAPSAHAGCQNVYQADLSGQTGGSLVLVCTPDPTPSGGGSGSGSSPTEPKKPKRATAKQLRTLRFVPQASAEKTVQAELVRAFGNTGDPELDAKQTASIESGALTRQFRVNLRRQRWSTRDVGDYYALAYLTGWSVMHDGRTTSTKVDRAVRRVLKDRLARQARFRRMNDTQQHAYAERLAAWTAVLAGNYAAAKRDGDKDGMAEAAYNAEHRLADDDLLGAYIDDAKLSSKGITGDFGTYVKR